MSDKPPVSKEAKKKLLLVMLLFAVTLTVYLVLVRTEATLLIDLSYFAVGALFVVYFYLSYGMAKDLPTKDELNPKWSEARRIRFAEKIRKNKATSQKMLPWLVPLIVMIAIDILRRFLIDT